MRTSLQVALWSEPCEMFQAPARLALLTHIFLTCQPH